ncbi:nucleotide sugar dehydrogenase [Candidatus Pelagibacter bacterium]|nr:nucleotide sugar dehydrogenase [Candidatus Pelagibacter bacterium]
MLKKKLEISIVGLGYVGLPLAISFSKYYKVFGFDLNKYRINNLQKGYDETLEVNKANIIKSKNLTFTKNLKDLKKCNCHIVTVPTPIDRFNKPDFRNLISASRMIGKILKKNDTIIYESTVYPGATEEICVPILEKNSNLKFNVDFFVGYSPERMNPGDKKHNVENIIKVTSGSNEVTANFVNKLYRSIVKAGTYKASSIKVAEAAKVIENTQRDINISLINELSLIFNKLNIDTEEVLRAAGTKWNFLPFRPGLVGGHCIGVDPYYLTYKSKKLGYNPKIILAGRNLNDNMSTHIANKLFLKMREKKIKIANSKILIMGVTFKENCPDIRNSKVFDLVKHLKRSKVKVSVYDPWVNENQKLKGINLIKKPKKKDFDCIILAVSHSIFKKMGIKKINNLTKKNHIIYDLKYIFSENLSDLRL